MSFHPAARDFLTCIQQPEVRKAIRASPNRTMLYAGSTLRPSALGKAFEKPMWKEIADLKAAEPDYRDKEILPEVLARIALPGSSYASLLAYAQAVEAQVPWNPDGFEIWKALSEIFASNAAGKVSFYIGSGISPDTKVFAATEVAALLRNPNVDQTTRDLLAYYQRCIQRGETDINLSFLSA